MRGDEAVTYLDFVRLSWTDIVSTYTTSNNHVFSTLLSKAATSLLGDAPWALRLPAFIAGVVTLPATYLLARTLYGARVALVASTLVATSGGLVLYSSNARGFALIVLAFVVLRLVAVRIVERGTGPWPMFVAVGALGLWSSPAMLFPLGSVWLWIVFNALVTQRRALATRATIAMATTLALALLLYAPIIASSGFAAIVEGPRAHGWFEFFQTLPSSVANAVMSWSLGVPMLSVALVALAALSLRRPESRFPVGVGRAAFVWCSVLLLATHQSPPSRVWLWIFPVIAMRAAFEIVAVLEGRERTRSVLDAREGLLAAVFALVLAVSVVTTRAVPLSRETGSFRDARAIAEELGPNLAPTDVVFAAPPSNGPLSYYLRRAGITPPAAPLDSARRIFVIVDVAEGQTLDRLTEGSIIQDTTRFTIPRVVGTFTTSGIFLYLRRGSPR